MVFGGSWLFLVVLMVLFVALCSFVFLCDSWWFFEVRGGSWNFLVVLKVLGCFSLVVLMDFCVVLCGFFVVFWGLWWLLMVLGDYVWSFEVLGGSRNFFAVFEGS